MEPSSAGHYYRWRDASPRLARYAGYLCVADVAYLLARRNRRVIRRELTGWIVGCFDADTFYRLGRRFEPGYHQVSEGKAGRENYGPENGECHRSADALGHTSGEQ